MLPQVAGTASFSKFMTRMVSLTAVSASRCTTAAIGDVHAKANTAAITTVTGPSTRMPDRISHRPLVQRELRRP